MRLMDVDDALVLLAELGAPRRLVRHHELVAEAARELIEGIRGFGARFDERAVLLGAALHDVGKIEHPVELSVPGSLHEPLCRDP